MGRGEQFELRQGALTMPEPTIREQVETILREQDRLFGWTVSYIMRALSPLLERVERTETDLRASLFTQLVRDLKYRTEPSYGHRPIRHQFAWTEATKGMTPEEATAAADEAMVDEVQTLASLRKMGHHEGPYESAAHEAIYKNGVDRGFDQCLASPHVFESELRRRVEALTKDRVDSLVSIAYWEEGETAAREAILTALLAPPAIPETERE